MEKHLTRFPNTWWLVLLRGILTCMFGLLVFFHPERTIIVLLQIIGIFWLIEGIFLVIAAMFGHIYEIRWGALLVRGVISTLAGIIVLSHPLISALVTIPMLAYILAFLAIVSGVMELITAVGIRDPFSNKWSAMAGGTLSSLIGIFLLFHPFVSAAVAMSIIGVLIFVVGFGRITLAFYLCKRNQKENTHVP